MKFLITSMMLTLSLNSWALSAKVTDRTKLSSSINNPPQTDWEWALQAARFQCYESSFDDVVNYHVNKSSELNDEYLNLKSTIGKNTNSASKKAIRAKMKKLETQFNYHIKEYQKHRACQHKAGALKSQIWRAKYGDHFHSAYPKAVKATNCNLVKMSCKVAR